LQNVDQGRNRDFAEVVVFVTGFSAESRKSFDGRPTHRVEFDSQVFDKYLDAARRWRGRRDVGECRAYDASHDDYTQE
jgi:hypothetical protein